MGDMSDAFIRQLEEHSKSMYIDRTGWTRQQWIDDARALMYHIDGAITSLVNGHVMALLEEEDKARTDLQELQELVDTQDRMIEQVRNLLGDITGPLWSVRGVREADLVTALDGPAVVAQDRVEIDRQPINIIFDGPPSAVSGRFIEVELDDGSGVSVGEWIKRSGRGTWALRITELPRKKG